MTRPHVSNDCRCRVGIAPHRSDETRAEFEEANAIDDPFQRVNAIDKIRRGVCYYAAASGHKPNGLIPARFPSCITGL